MVGWHHQLSGHEFEQILGDGEGQGSLEGCSLWGCKESDTAEQQSNNHKRKPMSSQPLHDSLQVVQTIMY